MKKFVIIFFTFIMTGCGTLANMGAPFIARQCMYGGVRIDAELLTSDTKDGFIATLGGVVIKLGALIDMPLSAVGDTLTLPITAGISCEVR